MRDRHINARGLLVLALALACGPAGPVEATDATGATTQGPATGGSTGATASGTGTGEATTTGVTGGNATTGMGESHATGTDSSSATGAESSTDAASTTEPAECMVDPSQNLCSEGCDWFIDCCKCQQDLLVPAEPTICAIATQIVASQCPDFYLAVSVDGMQLPGGFGAACGAPNEMWVKYPQDGDLIIELCGDTCAAYLDGTLGELAIQNDCEAA